MTSVLLLLTLLAVTAALGTATENATPPTRLYDVTRENHERTVGRAGFALVVYHQAGCAPCDEVLEVVREAAAETGARGIPGLYCLINMSNPDDIPRGVEYDPEKLGLSTFPALRVAHFGRVNHKLMRIPRRTADELASWVDMMARPSSVGLRTAEELVTTVERAVRRAPAVVGAFADQDSQNRLREMADEFRGLVQFYHLEERAVAEVLLDLRANATLRRRYLVATRQTSGAPTANRKAAEADGDRWADVLPRRNSFVIYKQQYRNDVDLFDRPMKKARKAQTQKTKRAAPAFDPLRADGGDAASSGDVSLVNKPSPEDLRAGGMTAWFHAPTVSSLAAFADRFDPDEFVASDAPQLLTGPNVDRLGLLRFIARHVFPPVDVLTVHNREHINLRTPYAVLYFTEAVSAAVADEVEAKDSVVVHGIHEERSYLLDAVNELRYVAGRLESLSDEFPEYSFLFCAYNDNRQVFHQFGLDIDAYEQGKPNLIGVVRGEQKFTYTGAPKDLFDARHLRDWLRQVDSGLIKGFVKSTPAPQAEPAAGSGRLSVVVYNTFDRYIIHNRSRDVFVVFAHETTESERMLKHFASIAAAEANNTEILVVAFDALNNDPPPTFPYEALPTAFFVQKGGHPTNVTPIEYAGDFSLRSLANFASQHAASPMRNNFTSPTKVGESAPPQAAAPDQTTHDKSSVQKRAPQYQRRGKSNTFVRIGPDGNPVEDADGEQVSGTSVHVLV
jgi:hypothetical protein